MKELKDFENYLIRNFKSKRTIDEYLRDIIQFLQYFKEINLNQITYEDIEDYKKYMLYTQCLSPKTINRKLVSINQFLTFNQITVMIKQVKIHTQNFLNDILDDEDVRKLICATEEKNDLRAKTLIMTLQLTGMRISECLQLTINDINKDTVMIVGKGNKRRNVFIPEKLRQAWNDYCKIRVNKSDFLFTGNKGQITRFTAHRIIKKYAEISDVDFERAFCHNFRHKYVSDLIKREVTIDTVADLVGHSSIETTRLYSKKSKKQLLDIINEL